MLNTLKKLLRPLIPGRKIAGGPASGVRPTGDVKRDAGLYWARSSGEDVVRDLSHWRGQGRWAEREWLELGEFHMGLVGRLADASRSETGTSGQPGDADAGIDRVSQSGSTEGFEEFIAALPSRNALEWGPGGGANSRLLCASLDRVYGVDISEANIEECVAQMEAFGFKNFVPVLIDSSQPEQVDGKVPEDSLGFILSTAVFQHFPSRQYSLDVLKIMGRLLAPGGYAFIQVRYDDGSDQLKQKTENYFDNVIFMTSFGAGEFAAQAAYAGLTVVASERDLDREPNGKIAHYEYFLFRNQAS